MNTRAKREVPELLLAISCMAFHAIRVIARHAFIEFQGWMPRFAFSQPQPLHLPINRACSCYIRRYATCWDTEEQRIMRPRHCCLTIGRWSLPPQAACFHWEAQKASFELLSCLTMFRWQDLRPALYAFITSVFSSATIFAAFSVSSSPAAAPVYAMIHQRHSFELRLASATFLHRGFL